MTLKYPIGIQDFASLRNDGYVYIDKTEDIYRLISLGRYYFLSRPRRFGKSLMLSTIKYIFEGRRELFEGLYIDSSDHDWTVRPVFHLDFASADVNTIEGLYDVIDTHLRKWEHLYEVSELSTTFSQRFYNVLQAACERSGQRVVVLIDEYDKMLVNNLHRPELHEEIRNLLRPVYANLKAADQYIHFAILTGVSRFSRLSIFSDLNNLLDISLDDRFSTLCGITEEEIRRFLAPGVEEFAQKEEVDFEGMMGLLKANYDGYHFSRNSPDIYNPFSLISALSKRELEHFWYATGTPSFLVKMMQHSDEDIREILNTKAFASELESSDTQHSNLTAVLFQTGYLTIKDFIKQRNAFVLGVPNHEVEKGLFETLLPQYAGRPSSTSIILKIADAVDDGEPERFLSLLQSFLADIPYDLSKNKPEVYFENNLYIIFKLLGFYVTTEYRTSQGRVDIVLSTPKYVYVIELKLNGTAEDAIAQIEDRAYALPFATADRQIITIGIGFSQQTRNIDRWIIKEL